MLDLWVTYAATGLLAALALVALWRWLRPRREVVTLTAHGNCDRRLTPELIPWRTIEAITEGFSKGKPVVILQVQPTILATFTLAKPQGVDRRLGIKGLRIGTQGLAVRYGRLRQLIRRYHKAATGTADPA